MTQKWKGAAVILAIAVALSGCKAMLVEKKPDPPPVPVEPPLTEEFATAAWVTGKNKPGTESPQDEGMFVSARAYVFWVASEKRCSVQMLMGRGRLIVKSVNPEVCTGQAPAEAK